MKLIFPTFISKAWSPRLRHSLERYMPPPPLMIMKKLARVSPLKTTHVALGYPHQQKTAEP